MDSLPRETRLGIRLYVVPAYHGGKKATRPDVEMKTRWKMVEGTSVAAHGTLPGSSCSLFLSFDHLPAGLYSKQMITCFMLAPLKGSSPFPTYKCLHTMVFHTEHRWLSTAHPQRPLRAVPLTPFPFHEIPAHMYYRLFRVVSTSNFACDMCEIVCSAFPRTTQSCYKQV